MDTLGIEPRAFRMRSGCDTTTPCARCHGDGTRAYVGVRYQESKQLADEGQENLRRRELNPGLPRDRQKY